MCTDALRNLHKPGSRRMGINIQLTILKCETSENLVKILKLPCINRDCKSDTEA